MKKILIIILSIIITACNKEKKTNGIINIDNAKEINYNPVVNIVKNIEFIPLETTENNLMGYIDRVSIINNKIYIFDHLTNKIHIFNNIGEWENTLDKKGKGPGEYLYIKDYSVDTYGNIYLLTHKKILIYNKNLELIETIKTPDIKNHIKNFFLFDKSNIVLYNSFSSKFNVKLLAHFKNNRVVETYGQIKEKDSFNFKRFIKYKDVVNLVPPLFSNEILSVDKNFVIKKKYTLKLDEEHNKENKKNRFSKTYLIYTFIETENYVYFTYNGRPIKHCLYNKKTGDCFKSVKSYSKKDFGICSNIVNVSNDNKFLLGIISAIELIRLTKDLEVANSLISKEQIEALKSIKEIDNPVVIKIELKQ